MTTAALADLRAEIDAVDAEMVALLARRMDTVERVIAVKRKHAIPALVPERVDDVIARVRAQAAQRGTPPDLAAVVWNAMMAWVISYEERRLAKADEETRTP